ncbi:hypothetical protein Q7C36_000826 [Tachysurus vachellii]|uniref:Sushi domain-containing protein n=1 Tax=Tachysurus vachellii TaxID=175792 RepID=A0AA88TCK6_TACVA|nr:hypothetical protein Q7C36_000826 [Tachysurus vachellii]
MESSLFVLYLFFLARVYTSAFDEITCSPPVAKENIIVDGLPDNDDLLRYGHQLQFTCKSGFKLVGQKDVTCGENGVWNHPSPICEANKDCVAPPYVEFADITTLQKSHYSSGESVKYMCQNLYTLSGQSYKTCTHGMWSGLMKCLKPCIVNIEDMDARNIQQYYGKKRKMFTAHEDRIIFKCQYRRQPKSYPSEFNQLCNDGFMKLPSCQ